MSARFLLLTTFVCTGFLCAEQITVRYPVGRVHGFVVLRDTSDSIIASGDVSQVVSGNQVTSEISLRFKDGSVHQETAVFSQRRVFQLINYRLVQKGKTFKRPTDLTLNASTGQITIKYTDEDGAEKTIAERLKLPPDVSNGMMSTLLCDIDPKTPKTTVSMVVSTPKPRIVGLEITPQGEDAFTVAGVTGKATRYNVKIDIGGLSGALAPIVGKQPPDTQVWIVRTKAPGFLRSQGPMCDGCPIWRIELTSPVWP